jgi:hypothetical protein
MAVPTRLGLFALVLAVVFGAAALAGAALDPSGADPKASGHSGGGGEHAQEELRLELADARRAHGDRAAQVRLRVVDADGAPIRDFDVAHEKRMHLIVVRSDLRGFQHLHPAMAADGTWTATANLARAGVYRVYADFTRDGAKHALGSDLHVAGDYRPAALPAPATVSTAGDLAVTLRRDGDRFAFDVRRAGKLVNGALQPYLGAKGHLVTLRADDLAYMHTHPEADQLAFDTELPSAGRYRMWVQFKLDGRVRTAAFTQEAGA